jgi:hypothetical protein
VKVVGTYVSVLLSVPMCVYLPESPSGCEILSLTRSVVKEVMANCSGVTYSSVFSGGLSGVSKILPNLLWRHI